MRRVFLFVTLVLMATKAPAAILFSGEDPLPTADGYSGIWYSNQAQDDEYVYKYSGGLGTYCAKHRPFAIYAEEVDKTFFVYGGTNDTGSSLLHMVSYYDHATDTVPQPRILLDKQTTDAHDNPVISMDDDGYIWIFSSSHGTARQSFIHRSAEPYSIDAFDLISTQSPSDAYSYTQPWHVPGEGFMYMHTHYDGGARNIYFSTSEDGTNFTPREKIYGIEAGHYQVSAVDGTTVGSAFNVHPSSGGLNYRTNLYYIETPDMGDTWMTADGTVLNTPLLTRTAAAPALVHDYASEGLNCYMKDLVYDASGNPVITYITSSGWEAGPVNDPRTWCTARWTGADWTLNPITTSNNNYDMGSLYIEDDGTWRLIAPTEDGPQEYNPGGEMAMWVSSDQGVSWTMTSQLTNDSPFNHTYARRPVDAQEDFYAIWADGHARQKSVSRLYFTTKDGTVYQLPTDMDGPVASPHPYQFGGDQSAAYADAVLADSPTHYYRMSEYNGLTAANTGTASGFEGVLTGAAPDCIGPALAPSGDGEGVNYASDLSGSGARVEIADPGTGSALDFGSGDSITMEAWVDMNAIDSGYRYIFSKGRNEVAGSFNQNYGFRVCYRGEEDPSRLGFIFRNAADTQWNLWETTESLEEGWHHVAMTFTFGDADTIKMFVDGEEWLGEWLERSDFGDGNDAPFESNEDLWIGSAQDGATSSSFPGQIDEAALYRAYLSGDDILAHYLAAFAIPGDLDGDGTVGSGDLDIVRSNWGQSVTAGDLSLGDANGDGMVGSGDLDIVRANWGTGLPSAVPEPATLLLCVAALSAFLPRWRYTRS